jgi:hypothetical protein
MATVTCWSTTISSAQIPNARADGEVWYDHRDQFNEPLSQFSFLAGQTQENGFITGIWCYRSVKLPSLSSRLHR